ncbi:uncharacterized protein LOC107641180 [Arachis ipaensis]|uniref:uncharacterized protein LOC107641180 n=1 Tax=Arachis ipaensis TaxID=130454 RepID=UPI0007AF32FA|nr:uncharacterized protein LOC107641180 [Arachis ipaensis]
MTTIINPMMVDHESKFDRLTRQFERITRIVDYDEGERQNVTRIVEDVLNRVGFNIGIMNQPHFVSTFSHNVQMAEVPRGVKNPKIITKFTGEVGESTTEHVARYLVEIGNLANDESLKMKPNSIIWAQLETAFHAQFYRGELNVTVTDLVVLERKDGENIDDYMIRFKNARSRCYVSLPESEVVKIAVMGLGFYMRRKLLNVHIPDLARLAERVRQEEILKKEKEMYKSERRLKSKTFSRKKKVAYVAMESSEEESNLEVEVDLAELKKDLPYVCSLLKKLPSSEKSNDSKLKSRKRYSFDISKSDQIFYVLLKDK